jgi:hypothetical protein
LSAVAVAACANVIKENNYLKRHRRRKWCKNWLLEIPKFSHIHLLTELESEKHDCFNYLRMDEETYLKITETKKNYFKYYCLG